MAPRCAPDVRAQAIHELINSDGGPDAIKKLARTVSETRGDGLGLNTLVREAVKPNWAGALMQMRINGLLSRPSTHIVNAVGNKLVAGMAIPERLLAAGFSRAFHGGEIGFGEVTSQMHGFMQGMRDGMKLVVQGKRAADDDDVSDLFEMFRPQENMYVDHLSPELVGKDDGSAIGRGLAYLGKGLNLPTKALGVADDYFKAIGYRMELNALAHRQARSEGLEGDEFVSRMNDLMNNPSDELKMDAMDVARYQTFTNDLGPMGRKFQNFANSHYAVKFVFPFIRTPANILKYTFERTPIAALSGNIRADLRAGGTRAAQAEARMALGSMLMMWGGWMAMEGRITGGGSQNQDQQKIARQSGWQPYSVKIGDRYFAYNRLEPLGMMLGIAADVSEMTMALDGDDQEMLVAAGAAALAQNLASKTYLSGAFDVMAALDDGNYKGSMGRYIREGAMTFLPYYSAVRGAARAADPILRDSRAMADEDQNQAVLEYINSFKAKVPGLSSSLPPRRDLWGKPVNVGSGLGSLYDFVSPIATSVHDPDPAEQAILDNETPISWPQRQINGVKLSPEEYSEFSRIAGETAKERLDQYVKTPSFKALSSGPDGMQSQIIRKIISASRDQARKMILQEFPDLQKRMVQNAQEKARALAGQR